MLGVYLHGDNPVVIYLRRHIEEESYFVHLGIGVRVKELAVGSQVAVC